MPELTAGVELNYRVASVLGWKFVRGKDHRRGEYFVATNPVLAAQMKPEFVATESEVDFTNVTGGLVPSYSTDPGAAMQALEELCRAQGLWGTILTDGTKTKVTITKAYDTVQLLADFVGGSSAEMISRAIVVAHESLNAKA